MGNRRSPSSMLSDTRSRITSGVKDDSGAVLILALIFIIAIALIMLSLLSLTGNDIINASNLQSERALDYAADGATTASVQAVRYSNTQFSESSSQPCMPNGASSIEVDGVNIVVECEIPPSHAPPNSPCPYDAYHTPLACTTRVVRFFACTTGGPSCAAGSPALVVQAEVAFDDYPDPPGSADVCTPSTGTETCGIGMAVVFWSLRGSNS
jgi:hypothetical protein